MTAGGGHCSVIALNNHLTRTGINNADSLYSNSPRCSAAPRTGVMPVTLKKTKKQEEDEARLEEDF